MQRFLGYLVIVCLALAGVSPACKFISGQSQAFMEICSADGSVKTIAVSPDYLPTSQPKQQDHQKAQSDCAFCFAQTHFNSMLAQGIVLAAVDFEASYKPAPLSSSEDHAVRVYEARGPPSFS